MVDDHLIARAQSLAGGEVHDVVSMIYLYISSYQISLLEEKQEDKDLFIKRMELCEQALRMFVAGKSIKKCDAWLRVELDKNPIPPLT